MRFHTLSLSALLPALFFSLLTTGPALAAGPRVDDVCVGNGTPGPFALSWNHVVLGTESVTINGLAQMRGLDYTLNADGGTVTFSRSLSAHSAAQVSYERDPAEARQAATEQSVPLRVDLLRSDQGYLSFQALGKPGDDARGNLTLGVGLGWHPSSTASVATHFYFAPVTASADPSSLSTEKRSGLSVSGSAGAGSWALFSFGFARAGVSLGDCGEGSEVQAGRQTLSLSSRFSPNTRVQALVSYDQSRTTDDPAARAAGKTALSLSFTPSDKMHMSANVAQSGTEGVGATQTVNLALQSQPNAKLQVSATYDGNDAPGTAADSRVLALSTVLIPGKTISLETAAAQSRGNGQTTTRQSFGLSLRPRSDLQLQAGLALRQKDLPGKESLGTSLASVSADAKPLPFLELSGGFQSRMASSADPNPHDQLDSSIARFSLSLLPFVHLVGTYAQNPDDQTAGAKTNSAQNAGGQDADTLQRLARKGVSLETNLGALGLSGGCDWSRRYDTPEEEQTVHADLGLRFSASTHISVGYQSRQNLQDPAASQSIAYSVGFTHSLGDRFSFSLRGKSQKIAAAAPPDYKASANLGMKF